MEVDREGNVKSQGEAVQKVYVDGKEFFGNDPKLATKNITADMIESVQVFDDMSDQAKFTRLMMAAVTKTLNIKLKKDRNKGYFGRAALAYGNQNRYEGNLSMNKFNGDQRISLILNANNTNKQGYSFSDVIGSMGGFNGFGNNGGAGGGGRGSGGGRRSRQWRRWAGGGGSGSGSIEYFCGKWSNRTDEILFGRLELFRSMGQQDQSIRKLFLFQFKYRPGSKHLSADNLCRFSRYIE